MRLNVIGVVNLLLFTATVCSTIVYDSNQKAIKNTLKLGDSPDQLFWFIQVWLSFLYYVLRQIDQFYFYRSFFFKFHPIIDFRHSH